MGVVTDGTWKAALKHTSAGVPKKCSTVQTAMLKNPPATADLNKVTTPTGGLYGLSYALNVNDAAAFGIDPTTIDDFAAASLHAAPGSDSPSLNEGKLQSWNQTPAGGFAKYAYVNPVDAVSGMMMTASIQNDVMVNAAVGGQSDWVVTFPTKRFYVDPTELATATLNGGYRPFNEAYIGKAVSTAIPASLACEDVSLQMWDREEQTTTIDFPGFSPAPPGAKAAEICLEMNVLQMGLESSLNAELPVSGFAFAFDEGWAKMTFASTKGLPGSSNNATTRHSGLPAIGFLATKYENSSVADGAFNYGHVAEHKYDKVGS